MTVEANKETLGFQTEVKQLLHLMIHSLYSNKEIFLRELISNASDAEDKLRFAALKDDSLYESDPELKIRLDFDEEANTVTLTDNGIGMTRDDVIQNLGVVRLLLELHQLIVNGVQALAGLRQKLPQQIIHENRPSYRKGAHEA